MPTSTTSDNAIQPAPPLSSQPPPKVFKAVIPAAGLGTRLRPLTRTFPKELLPVGREPVLAYIAAELREAGITDVLFIVSARKPQIRDFFGDNYSDGDPDLPPLRCAYVTQKEQCGLGDALLYSEDWVGMSPFVVAFGDCIIEKTENEAKADNKIANKTGNKTTDEVTKGEITESEVTNRKARESLSPLQRLVMTFADQRAEAAVLVEAVEWSRVSRYGVVAPCEPVGESPHEPFALRDIVEKPTREEAPSRLAVAARWVVQPTLFPFLRQSKLDARGERNMTDAVRALLGTGKTGWAVPLRTGEARRDIGNFESFLAQCVRAALRDAEFGATAQRVAREELARIDALHEP